MNEQTKFRNFQNYLLCLTFQSPKEKSTAHCGKPQAFGGMEEHV